MTRLPQYHRFIQSVFIALIAVVAATLLSGGALSAGNDRGLANEKKFREQYEQEFRDTHSDKAGRLRSDLWRKGISDFRRMPISATWRTGSKQIAANRLSTASDPAVVGVQWTQYGPRPLR